MKRAAYLDGEPIDEDAKRLIKVVRSKIVGGADDAVFLVVGPTGSGKSNLSLWLYTLYADEPASSQMALNKEMFVQGLQIGDTLPVESRVLVYDELELNRRNSTTKWNVDMMTLYYKIRGKRFLHLWNHPSLEMVDREFVRERINGVFFVYDKAKNRPRKYYFYTKESIMRFYDRFQYFPLELMKQHANDYALFQGCFRQYDGPLKLDYDRMKNDAMSKAITDFVDKYGGRKTYSLNQVAQKHRIGKVTIAKALKVAVAQGRLPETVYGPTGRVYLDDVQIQELVQVVKDGAWKA